MACVSLGQLHRPYTLTPLREGVRKESTLYSGRVSILPSYMQDLACYVEVDLPDEHSVIAWRGCALQVFDRSDILVRLTNKTGLVIRIACGATSDRVCPGGY